MQSMQIKLNLFSHKRLLRGFAQGLILKQRNKVLPQVHGILNLKQNNKTCLCGLYSGQYNNYNSPVFQPTCELLDLFTLLWYVL